MGTVTEATWRAAAVRRAAPSGAPSADTTKVGTTSSGGGKERPAVRGGPPVSKDGPIEGPAKGRAVGA